MIARIDGGVTSSKKHVIAGLKGKSIATFLFEERPTAQPTHPVRLCISLLRISLLCGSLLCISLLCGSVLCGSLLCKQSLSTRALSLKFD